MMLIVIPPSGAAGPAYRTAVFLARIVMPFSRSRSPESIARSWMCCVLAEGAGLPEHGVDEGRLAVVDVRDDRDVAEVIARGEGHGERDSIWLGVGPPS